MNGSGGSEQAGVCVVGGRFMFHFMTRRHERCQRRKPAFAHRTAGKDKLVIMQGSHRFFVDYRYDSCGLFAEGVIPKTAIGVPAAKERFVPHSGPWLSGNAAQPTNDCFGEAAPRRGRSIPRSAKGRFLLWWEVSSATIKNCCSPRDKGHDVVMDKSRKTVSWG